MTFKNESISIFLGYKPLEDFDVFSLFHVIKTAKYIEMLYLKRSSLKASHIKIAHDLLTELPQVIILIKMKHLVYQVFVFFFLLMDIASLYCYTDAFYSCDCCTYIIFTVHIFQRIPQINSLNLSDNRDIDCKELWKIVILCQVKNLRLRNTGVTEDGLKQFQLLMQSDCREGVKISTFLQHICCSSM